MGTQRLDSMDKTGLPGRLEAVSPCVGRGQHSTMAREVERVEPTGVTVGNAVYPSPSPGETDVGAGRNLHGISIGTRR